MSSPVKWILGAIAALILLVIIIIVSIPLFIDPNDYKDKITEAVHKQTGRELSIPGDIKLSVSPSLKAVFRIGDVSMSSSEEFKGTDFFSSELVEINLALWPLIASKTLQVNNVTLKGVNVNLIRRSSGSTNWEDLAGGKKTGETDQPTTTDTQKPPEDKPAKTLPKIDIGGVNIADINVTYTDEMAGRTVKLSNFNLQVGHVLAGKPFPVDADFTITIDDGKKPLSAKTGFSTNLTFDLAKLVFLVDQLKLTTDISGAPVPVKLFGLEMDAEANLGKSVVDVSALKIHIDDTTIDGTASITDLQNPSYKAALHIDQLNLDRYKIEKKKPAEQAETASQSAETQPRPAPGPGNWKPAQQVEEELPIIPVDLLRGLTFDAEIKVDKLVAAKLVTTDILIKATGNEGLIRLEPFSANLYQGTVTVNGDIDARQDIPKMKLTKVLQSVEMGPLFMDMKGKEEVKGTADINVEVTTHGLTKKQLTYNSNGTMKLSLQDGEIAKLKIIDTIRFAKQLYEGGAVGQPSAKEKQPSGRPTSFANLSASGTITKGVFRNNDLLAESELMRVTGKGTVNLNTEEIDYLLTIYLAKSLERDEEKDLVEMADTPIPYKVTGTFDKIDQQAALGEILKAGAVKLLSKELEKQLGGDQEKSSEDGKKDATGGAEELINKGLKSLFGK